MIARKLSDDGPLHVQRHALWKQALRTMSVTFEEAQRACHDDQQFKLLLASLKLAGVEVTGEGPPMEFGTHVWAGHTEDFSAKATLKRIAARREEELREKYGEQYGKDEPMGQKMSNRICRREGCGNYLGMNNRSGVCTPCQQGLGPGRADRRVEAGSAGSVESYTPNAVAAEAGPDLATDPVLPNNTTRTAVTRRQRFVRPIEPAYRNDLERRFFTLFETLEADPGAMLDAFMEEQIARVRAAVGVKPRVAVTSEEVPDLSGISEITNA